MKYYIAFLKMRDEEKNKTYRQAHLDFVDQMVEQGHLFSYGRLLDGAGGVLVYQGHSLEDVSALAETDPYVSEGARTVSVHEWAMQSPYEFKLK